MAATFMDAGGSATADLTFVSSTIGTVAVVSAPSGFSGPYVYKASTGSPAADANIIYNGVLADAGRGLHVRMMLDAGAPAATENLMAMRTSGAAAVLQIQRLTSGVLRLNPVGGTPADGTTVLQANQVYDVALSYVITSTTVWTCSLYLNGVLEATATNAGTLTRTGTAQLVLNAPAVAGASRNNYYSDLYIDDSPSAAGIVNIRVTAKRPNANSTNTFDTTTATTNSGYGTGNSIYVNQRPLATTGARRMNGSGTATENFAIENAATGDVNLTGHTLVARLAWMHASGVTTDTLYDSGAAAVPASGTVSTTAGIRYKVSTSSTYPANPATGMGRPTGSGTTNAVLNECGVVFAYIESWVPVAIFGDN